MNLSTVKSIAVPEGNVTALSIGGVKAWAVPQAAASPWDEVAAAIADGTYKTKYKIGDMVPLDLGSEGLINMQIAAFDVDILADGSGTAAISWVAKEALATQKRMNPSYSDGALGTGAAGGWEHSELRAYLKNTVKPLLPTDVASMIQDVSKSQSAYNPSTFTSSTQTTTDDVWIPAQAEVFNGIYRELFPDDAARAKTTVTGAVCYWWLRNCRSNNQQQYYTITHKGAPTTNASTYTNGICLGFCTGRTPT